MSVTENEDHSISLSDAAKLTRNFRDAQPAPGILSHYFGKSALSGLLGQSGCVGIRIYNARKDDGTEALVMVGVISSGDDLEDGEILEWGLPCPPFCPQSSVLSGTA